MELGELSLIRCEDAGRTPPARCGSDPAFHSKFVQPGTTLTSDYIPGGEQVAVNMTLRVYDV